jgi:hypothetical protein
MQQAAKYRQDVGIIDADGKRHKIAAYLAIDPGNTREHYLAAYLLAAVGIGIEFPASAMDQFNKGRTWTVVRNSPIEGGHYIPMFAHKSNIKLVTWSALHAMDARFLSKYNDESVAYVSEEMLTNGKSVEGFDLQALKDALKNIRSA